MATAFIPYIERVQQATTSAFEVTAPIIYIGVDVPDGIRNRTVRVTVNVGASATTIRNAVTTAIINDAASLGITVVGSNTIMPAFQRGV